MDFKSLFAVNIFGLVLCALVLTMNALGARKVRVPAAMVLCAVSGAAGLLLLSLYGRVNELISVVAGVFCLQMAFVFMYRGYSWMTMMPKRGWIMRGWQVLLGTTLVSTAGIAYFTLVQPAVMPRMALFSVSMIIGALACMVLLLRVPDVFLREASWLSILCLGLCALGSLVRLVEVLRHPPTVAYLEKAVAQPGFLLVNMIAISGLTYGHIWITGARQRMVLQAQAYTDDLTGVLNRRALEVEAGREMSRSRRGQRPLAVMMCDLDKFKAANDALGHQYGDAVLMAVASTLRATVRREDLIARLGGDEFVVLLPDTNRERAMEVAERLRGDIERLHVVEQGRHTGLQASFGLAMLDDVVRDSWRSLMERADAALYAAKQAGGNHIVMGPVAEVAKLLDRPSLGTALPERSESSGLTERRPFIN